MKKLMPQRIKEFYEIGPVQQAAVDDLIDAVRQDERQKLAQFEQPMSPEHLPKYFATNGVKPMEGGGGGGSQPECDWTTDTPVPPFKYLNFPECKIAQPEREWVGLTEEEVDAIRKEIFKKFQKALLVTGDVTTENNYSAFNFYLAIEKKLRSKNDI